MDELRFLVPNGMLGFGYPLESLKKGLAKEPHFIGIDSGSTDAGPHKLGSGISKTVGRGLVKRDLRYILRAGCEKEIPVVIGSAGGAGGNPHLEWVLDIINEINEEESLQPKIVKINAEIEKELLKRKIREDKVESPGSEPPLEKCDIDKTIRMVGMMGTEPYMEAMEKDPDVLVAGRSCDAAIFSSIGIKYDFPKGLSWHLGQIIECGAMCSNSKLGTADSIFATLREDHFVIESPRDNVDCTPTTIAAHGFYEEPHPSELTVPGGEVRTTEASFQQLPQGKVKVEGSKWSSSEDYKILIEGSARVGYRTVMIGGIRDPILINNIEELKESTKKAVGNRFSDSEYQTRFILYGKDGVMGVLETTEMEPNEIGLLFDVVASSQEIADEICSYARNFMQHYKYKNIKATAANLALPITPADLSAGPVYEFSVHHLMETGKPLKHFDITTEGGDQNSKY